MVEISAADFEQAVADGLDSIPDDLLRLLQNVAVLIEDEPASGDPQDLLGLYVGIPLTERTNGWGGGLEMPDRVMIFRGPLMRMCADRDELVAEIAITVVHEIAHHFGIDEDRLHALGWG